MLQENEAKDLMDKFILLREIMNESNSKDDIEKFKKHEKTCIEKFKYLVSMKTGRYKTFSNYEDLNQEGLEALIKGMKNYNPKKGSTFWWFHRYIGTRISRSANRHTTIRYPLKTAKMNIPHKESLMPVLIETRFCPDKELEKYQTIESIQNSLSILSEDQQNIIDLAYGVRGDKPMSVTKICKKLNISRTNCVKEINNALSIMRENIKQ